MSVRLGLIGARGYTGAELLGLVSGHPDLTLVYAASRALAGEPVQAIASEFSGDVTLSAPDPEAAARAELDVCVLALPNGASSPYVAAFERLSPHTALIDLSADHRFDDGWAYGLPERNRERIAGARRIANPGCSATAVQLALHPFLDDVAGPAHAFTVSGYSGAGTTPGPRNDVARLTDSIMPYTLVGHGHEAEIRRHCGVAVNFSPHVAGFFRGLIATVQIPLGRGMSEAEAINKVQAAYADEPLVVVSPETPELKDAAGALGAFVGGVRAVEAERRAVAVCALDNLLKGAASQALQNVNLALGLGEWSGLEAPGGRAS